LRIAALVMVGVAVALGAYCVWKGGWPLFTDGLRAGGRGALQLVPLLVVVFLLAGFAEVLVPRELVARWLSDASGPRGLLIAWVAGVITPGGGPVGLPIAAALIRAGAGVGVIVTYVTSMSLLSFVRVPLEVGIYGPRITALRVVSCVVLPLVAGVIAQVIALFLR
jgi:uncharacterized membrane protein YraQ (UPF0718 family)